MTVSITRVVADLASSSPPLLYVDSATTAVPQLEGRVGFSLFRSVVTRFTFFDPKIEMRSTTTALSGLGLGVRDRETSSVVGLCVKTYPNF